MSLKIIFSLCWGFALLTLHAADRVIEERLNYRILIPENATDVEEFAARTLAAELRKIALHPLKLTPEAAGPLELLVGFGETARQSNFPDWKRSGNQSGEFGIIRSGNRILLSGYDDPRVHAETAFGQAGTLSSVYWFCGAKAQAHYFAPGANGVKYTVDPVLDVAFGAEWVQPAYRVRGLSLACREFTKQEMAQYYRRMLGNLPDDVRPTVTYHFWKQWPQRFQKAHPEWFGLHGGKRHTGDYPYHFPCLSNPEVFRQIVRDLDEKLAQLPAGSRRVRLFCDAPYARCECADCAQLPAAAYCQAGDNSEEIYTYINKIAREVRKKYPDTLFLTQTKNSAYGRLPVTEPPEKNLLIEVLTGRPAVMDYTPSCELMKTWRDAGVRVLLKSYPRYPAWKNYPIMNPEFLADYFRTFQGVAEGPRQSDLRSNVPFSFCALNCYIQMRALREGDLDAESAVADFCALAYPGAETEMADFYRTMEDLLGKNSVWENPLYGALRADRLAEPAALLKAAAAKVQDPVWLAPLERDFAEFRKQAQAVFPIVAQWDRFHAEFLEHQQKLTSNLRFKPAAAPLRLRLYPKSPLADFQPGQVDIALTENGALRFEFTLLEIAMDKIKITAHENHTGSPWSDDSVEIMIAPPAGNAAGYLHLGVNAAGVFRAAEQHGIRNLKELSACNPAISVQRTEGGWNLSITLERKDYEPYLVDGAGRIGIFRTAFGHGAAQSSAIVPALSRGYHQLDEYAEFRVESAADADDIDE